MITRMMLAAVNHTQSEVWDEGRFPTLFISNYLSDLFEGKKIVDHTQVLWTTGGILVSIIGFFYAHKRNRLVHLKKQINRPYVDTLFREFAGDNIGGWLIAPNCLVPTLKYSHCSRVWTPFRLPWYALNKVYKSKSSFNSQTKALHLYRKRALAVFSVFLDWFVADMYKNMCV
jgi:hypothetical protein